MKTCASEKPDLSFPSIPHRQSQWVFELEKQIIRPTENSRQTRWLDSVDENDIVTGAYQLIYHVEPISKPEW